MPHLDGVQKYRYDANGNMIERIVDNDHYELTYDAENRLVEVKKNQTIVGEYTYDGNGNRAKSVVDEDVVFVLGTTWHPVGYASRVSP